MRKTGSVSLNESQMAGIPPAVRDAAAAKAAALGLDAPFAVTLSRSSVEPFLQYADDRALREQLYRAWVSRGDNDNAHNNTAIINETLMLRAERARLLGYENFAAYKLADSMAGTPAKARALLEEVWEPARKRALEERDALQALITPRRQQFPPGALGLALLRRKAPPGKICFRRRRAETLFPACQPDRSRLLHRRQAVRPFLPRTR